MLQDSRDQDHEHTPHTHPLLHFLHSPYIKSQYPNTQTPPRLVQDHLLSSQESREFEKGKT
jgi:hypothetical protein